MDRGQGKDRVRQGKVNCSPIHLLPAMASLLSHALHFLHSSPMAAAGFILHSHYLSHVKDLEEGRNNQLSLTYISLHYLHLSLFLVFICHFFLLSHFLHFPGLHHPSSREGNPTCYFPILRKTRGNHMLGNSSQPLPPYLTAACLS